MDVWLETFEFTRDDHIAEVIIDNIDCDPFVRFALKMVFKCLAGLVAFPDIRFQVNTFVSIIYGGQHSVKKVTAKIINLECIFPHFDRPKLWMWEGFVVLMLPTSLRQYLEYDHYEDL